MATQPTVRGPESHPGATGAGLCYESHGNNPEQEQGQAEILLRAKGKHPDANKDWNQMIPECPTQPHIPPPRCCGAALQHSQHFFHSEACSSPLPSLCSLSKAKTNRSLCAPRASMSGQLWAQLCLWLSGARMSLEHQELAGNQSVHHKPVALGSPRPGPGSDRAVDSQAVTARAVALNARETNPPEPQVPRAPGLPLPPCTQLGRGTSSSFCLLAPGRALKAAHPDHGFA